MVTRTIAFALLLLSTPSWAAPADRTGKVEGVVTGQRYGLPLSSVSVTLRSETLPIVEVRQTDRQGAFAFEGLPAGLYSLEAVGAGLERTTVSPVVVVPGVPVNEHLVVAEPRPYASVVPRS